LLPDSSKSLSDKVGAVHHSKTTRYIKPYKIENEALAQDVKDYPDDYHYERAQRFKCSPTGISKALKRIGISKKKDT
jgi:hypothetical protein